MKFGRIFGQLILGLFTGFGVHGDGGRSDLKTQNVKMTIIELESTRKLTRPGKRYVERFFTN